MKVSNELVRHRAEILRYLRNGQFERTDRGLIFPKMGAGVSGCFDVWVNEGDHEIAPNLVVNTGLDLILTAATASTTFYIAPYSNNVTPTGSLTAATAVSTLGEATTYTESTRQQWVQNSEASQSITNSTTKAVFTTDTGGYTCWGAFMTTANTKSATTGTLLAAAKFSASRSMLATDTLTLQYTLTLTSS